jgi:hypothetical protein
MCGCANFGCADGGIRKCADVQILDVRMEDEGAGWFSINWIAVKIKFVLPAIPVGSKDMIISD